MANPTSEEMTLEAAVEGCGLSGAPSVTLPPRCRGVYELVYFPSVVGSFKGSLVFYSAAVGEFWYELSLVATKPDPSNLEHMECELGRYVPQCELGRCVAECELGRCVPE